MSIEQNKKLASQFFARFDANDVAGALDCLAEDATWWIAGKPGARASAGSYGKRKIARLLDDMFSRLKDGMRMSVKGAIAEADKVAVEVESRGELKNGRVYNNEYHFLLRMRDGKIAEVREYLDTQHVFATWFEA
jgi:uncharacterized protein